MEHVWILAALCTGFVLVNMLLLNRKPPMAPASARSTTRFGQRTLTR
jgi:Flp pilus assembly protein protease CpaA